jgi:hypothetical protein
MTKKSNLVYNGVKGEPGEAAQQGKGTTDAKVQGGDVLCKF